MYAVVATVRVEDSEVARAALSTERVPLVARAPGFVAAYWLEPIDGIGMSVIVFDSRQNVEAAVQYPLPPLPGVSPIDVSVREVYASIQR